MQSTAIKCDLILPMVGDDRICDAARVSMAKMAAQFTREENAKLLSYLYKHKHWSPFGHAREIFTFEISDTNWLHFLETANLAGFTWKRAKARVFLSGSVWAWHENMACLPEYIANGVREWFHYSDRYKNTASLLFRVPPSRFRNDVQRVEGVDTREMANLLTASFRVTGPIFIARQLVKHQIDLCWNEESRRYISDEPRYYLPDTWRSKPEKSIKQGSTDEPAPVGALKDVAEITALTANMHYAALMERGVAPEDARMILPLNSVTEWIWTGTLSAWLRVVQLRTDGHAQSHTRVVGNEINEQLSKRFPVAWASLNEQPNYIERG